VAIDLKAIYSASTEAEAEFNLELFAEKWDALSPSTSRVVASPLDARDPVVCLPRRHSASVIYTTNAIESVNMTLRKVTRNHRIFPSGEAVYKGVYLAIRTIAVARGRCRSTTGNQHSIASPWNLRNDSRDEHT